MTTEPPRLRKRSAKRDGGMVISPRLRDVITGTSFVLWVANNVADGFISTYEPVASVNVVFVLIASAAFALSQIRKNINGDKKGDDQE